MLSEALGTGSVSYWLSMYRSFYVTHVHLLQMLFRKELHKGRQMRAIIKLKSEWGPDQPYSVVGIQASRTNSIGN